MTARPIAAAAAFLLVAAGPSAPASAQLFNMVVPEDCVAAPTVGCLVDAAKTLIDAEDLALRLVEADEIDLALTLADADDIDEEALVMAYARQGDSALVDALLAEIDDDDFASQVLPILGMALAEAGDAEAARSAFAAVAALPDPLPVAVLAAAYLQAYAGDPVAARALYGQVDIDDLDDDQLPAAIAVLTLLGDEDSAQAILDEEFYAARPSERSRILTAIGVTEYFAGDLTGALATLAEAKALLGGDREDLLDVAEQEAYAGLYKQSIDTALTTVRPEGYNGPVVDHIERVVISAILEHQTQVAAGLLRAQASWLIPAYYDTEAEALAVLSVVGADLEGAIAVAAAIDDLVERKRVLERVLEALIDDIYEIGAYRFPY